jgi:hypothetical protein
MVKSLRQQRKHLAIACDRDQFCQNLAAFSVYTVQLLDVNV